MAKKKLEALSPRCASLHHQILTAAKTVFLRSGFEKASMQEIVSLSGGSLSTIYKLFGNKQGLCEAVLIEKSNEFTTQFETIFQEKNFTDLQNSLELFSHHFFDLILLPESISLYRLIVMEGYRSDGELGRFFYENSVHEVVEFLKKLLTRFMPQMDEASKKLASFRLLGMLKEPYYLESFITGKPVELSDETKQTFIKQTVKSFIAGLH